MKIIYYDSTGRYLAVIAAAIHLNQLDNNVPEWEELKELIYFDVEEKIKPGKIIFIDRDQLGNDIYILGSDGVGTVIEKTIAGIKRIFNIESRAVFIDLTEYENWSFKFGLMLKGFNSFLANKLIYSNLVDSFLKIEQKVTEIKEAD
ncbi:DUF3189 family protein [Sporohalobacter salinus]|uniref:DUF3189 family protein n=1 Tax=Sporohalobacter salinus TaxID=1494606 RepID=UPI0019607217|nr:DUF3189 family protein [Sporohalobacter salinus]MBM7623846.1 hypothetical protein [Sporohalobacter salinus]